MPLLLWQDGCRLDDLAHYFETLVEFSHVLSEVGLGNIGEEEWAPLAHRFIGPLSARGLFQTPSSAAVGAVRCILDALGNLGLIHYHFTSGPASRDHDNPDLNALLDNAGHTLRQLGIQEHLFLEPARADYQFIMERRDSTGALTDPSFFSRPLWPRTGAHLKHVGVPTAFTLVIQDPWVQSLHNVGLSDFAASYLDLMEGMKLDQKRTAEPGSVTTGSVTIKLGQGAVFNGPLAIGHNINASLQTASDAQTQDLRDSLNTLVRQVSSLLSQIDSTQQDDVSSQLQAFVSEATSDSPNKWTLKASSAGLLAAAKEIGPVTESITTAVDKVMSLLGLK